MTIWTVQELINALQSVEDKERTVMVAGGGDGIALVGQYERGHLILWDAKEWRPVQQKLDAQMAEWVRESRVAR